MATSTYETAAREYHRLLAQLHSAERATTRASRLSELVLASRRQAEAADDADRMTMDGLWLRTALIEALAEVEAARHANRGRQPAARRIESAARGVLDALASRTTRDSDRPELMRTQLHPLLQRAVGDDVAHVVLVIADALPAGPAKASTTDPADPGEGALF